MKNKFTILLLLLIIISSLFIYGCEVSTEDIIPESMPIEDSIKEIISSKGENYDFLNDELFIKKINELGISNNFTLGNLDDGDTIPELVVFKERNPEDTNDQGKLEVYKFNGEKYDLLDSIGMNYDNNNQQMVIGKISETQNGLLLINQVGSNASVTYGYILENNKLKSILNNKKMSLISSDTKSEIKDVDGDGILEFSIYIIDPETEEQNSQEYDKIVLWYKWDEKDSGNLIMTDRSADTQSLDIMTFKSNDENIDIPDENFITYLKEHSSEYDKYKISELIGEHINKLNSNIEANSLELDKLITKYQGDNNFDYLEKKYGLSLERINDLEYLKREKILQTEPELKEQLIKNISMDYKVTTTEGMYNYVVNYKKIIDNFGLNTTKEYRDYLNIKSRESNEAFLKDGALMISREKLAARIVEIESFRKTYPYSEYIDELNEMYKKYVLNFIFGNVNTPNYDDSNKKFSDGSIAVFQNTINKYPESYLSEILQQFISEISLNANTFNQEIKEKINNLII
jgi:hypothetical protein